MKRQDMIDAFRALDRLLDKPLTLLIGGGAAMLLAHDVPLSTNDIDGLPLDAKVSPAELDRLVKKVATELGIGAHWYNDYFNTFTYALPYDFRDRLVVVWKGEHLIVKALGKEDLLIMKCFAGRDKDIGHARALLKRGAKKEIVEQQIEKLSEKGLPRSREALEFLEDLIDEMEG